MLLNFFTIFLVLMINFVLGLLSGQPSGDLSTTMPSATFRRWVLVGFLISMTLATMSMLVIAGKTYS